MNDQILTAEDIFASDDLTVVPLEIPEWKKNGLPGVLHLRVMSADETIKFQEAMRSPVHKANAWVKILALCACDPEGTRLFSDSDMEKLRKKSTAVFLRLQRRLLEMNGMARAEKTWDALREILVECGVESGVIALVQSKWESPEDAAKND